MFRRNPEPTAEAIKAAAEEALNYFHKDVRTSGEDFYKTENEPQWVNDMIHEAHGDMLPDDWKYTFVWEALNHITELDDLDDGPELEPDAYNNERLAWLSSNLTRASYVDEAMEEFGAGWPEQGVMEAVGLGQLREKEEVFFSILNSLKEHVAEAGE